MSRGSNKGAIRQPRCWRESQSWWRVAEVRGVPCSSGPLSVPAARRALLAFPARYPRACGVKPPGGWEVWSNSSMGPPALAANRDLRPVTAPHLRPLRAALLVPLALPALFMLQRVTAPGRYLNYPSALIRQPGARRGRKAGGEGAEPLELRARSRLPQRGWRVPAAGPGGGGRRRGRPAPPLVPSGGVSVGQASQSRVPVGSPPPGEWLAPGWVFMSLAEGSMGLTRTHPDPPCRTQHLSSSLGEDLRSPGSAKLAPFPKPAWKRG